jgi:hypothetical protein
VSTLEGDLDAEAGADVVARQRLLNRSLDEHFPIA